MAPIYPAGGFPDWVASIAGFTGTLLVVTNPLGDQSGRDSTVASLLSLCFLSIAAATKPMYGLLAIAVLIAIGADAARTLKPKDRNRLLVAAIGLVAIFVAAYALNFAHLAARSLPHYPVSTISERFLRAAKLLNESFSIPFKSLAVAGLAMSPFIKRIRWLALPMAISFFAWANTASYDLRNILGLLLISAFIPLYAAANAWLGAGPPPGGRRWIVPDGAVAAGWTVLSVGLR